MTDWRKQIMDQAMACCGLHWGLSKMHDPEQLMVWLDALEQGDIAEMEDGRIVRWYPRQRWPVKLPRGVRQMWTRLGAAADSREGDIVWVLYDDVALGGVLGEAFERLAKAQKLSRARLLQPQDIVEGELAWRVVQRLDKKEDFVDWPYTDLSMSSGSGKGGSARRTYAERTRMDEWYILRQRAHGSRSIYLRVAVVPGTSQQEAERLGKLLTKRGLPKAKVEGARFEDGPEVFRTLVFEWSLNWPRFNPWTRVKRSRPRRLVGK